MVYDVAVSEGGVGGECARSEDSRQESSCGAGRSEGERPWRDWLYREKQAGPQLDEQPARASRGPLVPGPDPTLDALVQSRIGDVHSPCHSTNCSLSVPVFGLDLFSLHYSLSGLPCPALCS